MRVLQVVHDYLPRHRAGAEIYTHQLSKALIRRGHEVVVLHAEYDREADEHSLRRGEWDGVPTIAATWKYGRAQFEETYSDPARERLFESVLSEVRPDIVHLQHLERFSIGVPGVARRNGLRVVYTLHEYALTCPRRGIRMMADLSLCEALDARRCAACILDTQVPPGSPEGGSRFAHAADWWRDRVVHRARRFVRKRLASVGLFDRSRVDERVRRVDYYGPEDWARMAQIRAIERRWKAVRRMTREVDLFISPSPFLLEKFVEFGVPRRRILFSDNGIDVSPFAGLDRRPSDKVRFAYAGTIDEHKGVHVLVEAMNGMPAGRASLAIHGDLEAFPEYVERLRKLVRHPDTRLAGPFDNARIAEVLRDVDVLVVPSLWFENSPLTIHEAFAAGAPVVATDHGGLRDLVKDGVSGLLFRRGDADDLSRAMRRLVDEEGLLERLRTGLPRVKTMDEDAADMEARYARLAGRARASR